MRSVQLGAMLSGVLSGLLLGPISSPAAMPWVDATGPRLMAGQTRLYPYGFNFNYGADTGRVSPNRNLNFFYKPTPARLEAFSRGMAKAKRMGADSLRIYLELGAFIKNRTELRSRPLRALGRVEHRAKRLHVYLDITGNLAWRPWRLPPWYDRLSYRERWGIQAHFWRAVGRISAASPSVLCYELTSEPIVGRGSGWYPGEFGGYHFVQDLAPNPGGRDPDLLARAWVMRLSRAIRREDHGHLITVGMLPCVDGPTGARNLVDLLDLLVVHQYPTADTLDSQVSVADGFAAQGKPLMLGEEFALDLTATRRFLRRTADDFQGYLSFFDGRTPDEITGSTAGDRLTRASLRQFLRLGPYLTRLQPWP
jgi:hypothetical protein